VRDRTDALDGLGNTTAATGKGFAIGSAVLTSLALLSAFQQQVGACVGGQCGKLDTRGKKTPTFPVHVRRFAWSPNKAHAVSMVDAERSTAPHMKRTASFHDCQLCRESSHRTLRRVERRQKGGGRCAASQR
jgi:hypothetical protein